MTTMREKMARAILKVEFYDCEPDMYGNDLERFYREVDPEHFEAALGKADAALDALEEPTDEMVEACMAAGYVIDGRDQVVLDWKTMLRAARTGKATG